jgi:hypothetical protein
MEHPSRICKIKENLVAGAKQRDHVIPKSWFMTDPVIMDTLQDAHFSFLANPDILGIE